MIYRFLFLSVLFINVTGFTEQKFNESDFELIQQFLGLSFQSFNFPDFLNPDKADSDTSQEIKKQIKGENLINIGLPTLPNLLPTALPKLPTIKIPDIIPKTLPTLAPIKLPTVNLPTLPHLLPTAIPTINIIPKSLPTLPPFKIPTIKLPTLPHILPTAFPTLFPNPIPSEGNLICDICENAVTVVKARFFKLEKAVRSKLSDFLGAVCDTLMKIPATMILATPCNVFKLKVIENVFNKLDKFEDSIEPKSFCKHVPFCK
uniref:Saposin B-type domain-containing protein n=1 Tax=Caenorhabditis tropicalis TaxID=1561998 RepID=A0A1I7TTE2_9PELO